jgi:hypothetical protein
MSGGECSTDLKQNCLIILHRHVFYKEYSVFHGVCTASPFWLTQYVLPRLSSLLFILICSVRKKYDFSASDKLFSSFNCIQTLSSYPRFLMVFFVESIFPNLALHDLE